METTRYQTTEYNRSERMLTRLRDIYSRAQIYKMSHAAILDALSADIYSTEDFRKLKPYYRGLFDGERRVLADDLYKYHLEWRVFFRGALVKGAEVPEGAWHEVETGKGEYVYRDAPERIF